MLKVNFTFGLVFWTHTQLKSKSKLLEIKNVIAEIKTQKGCEDKTEEISLEAELKRKSSKNRKMKKKLCIIYILKLLYIYIIIKYINI